MAVSMELLTIASGTGTGTPHRIEGRAFSVQVRLGAGGGGATTVILEGTHVEVPGANDWVPLYTFALTLANETAGRGYVAPWPMVRARCTANANGGPVVVTIASTPR